MECRFCYWILQESDAMLKLLKCTIKKEFNYVCTRSYKVNCRSWTLLVKSGVALGVNMDASVNVCVSVCVGLGLQVIPPGLGVHLPSLSHTTITTLSGTNPGSHWNTTTEPSVVLVWGCRKDPLTGGSGAPQSAVGLLIWQPQIND